MMLTIYICFIALSISGIDSGDIENKVMEYFESDAVKLLAKNWRSHQIAFENAVLVTMTETYGYNDMNVFVKKPKNPLSLSSGYLHSDNQVQILLLDLKLEELPHLLMPEVAFRLPSNILQIESTVSKMIVHANYMVFRNRSDIIYALQDQDPNQDSPFRFQQVQTTGKLAIIIEGCTLSGAFLTILNGQSVNLGHSLLGLTKCLYTFEITTPGFGGPPVIVRYNTKSEGLSLEHLLMKPLQNELIPKLQAAMFSYINTTAIFGANFPQIRRQQGNIFKATSNYINEAVRRINKLTIKKNQGVMDIEDFSIKWDDALEGDSNSSTIQLRKMVLTGLDSLYSAHIGGPYKLPAMKIGEEIRFDFLQLRGEAYFGNDFTHGSYDFSVEIHDVTSEITIGVNVNENRADNNGKKTLSAAKSVQRFEIVGWRTIEFAIPGIDFISTESLITGYLLNTLPRYLVRHLLNVYKDVTDQEKLDEKMKFKGQDSNGNAKNSDSDKERADAHDDNNNDIGNEETGENHQSAEKKENNEEHASDENNKEHASDEKNKEHASDENNEEHASDENNEEHASDENNKEHASDENNEEHTPDENNQEPASDDNNQEHASDDNNQEYVPEQEESAEKLDNNEEHASDDNNQEQGVEHEESPGNTEDDVEHTVHENSSGENKNLFNDTPDGLTESPSDEVDKHISRRKLIKDKNKKLFNITKTITDNEV